MDLTKNLLFIKGNRTEIKKTNIIESYWKMKTHGFIKDMPIEYFPMETIKDRLDGKTLLKMTLKRHEGEEDQPVVSKFEIIIENVKIEDYEKYDGVCADGQHRILAMQLSGLENIEPEYKNIGLPEGMDILAYIAMRNYGQKWNNNDFLGSKIPTHNDELDHILDKIEEGYEPSFLYSIYSLGTSNITHKQIKSIQQGYKKIEDFSKVQLDIETQDKGDEILSLLKDHAFLSKDRLTGRFGTGLKQFFNEVKDIEIIKDTLNAITKEIWEDDFVSKSGKSMEAKSFKQALKDLYNTKIKEAA